MQHQGGNDLSARGITSAILHERATVGTVSSIRGRAQAGGELKGGVGKTTIAANLIAHYTKKKNQRILAIDLDFQGSLSSMIIPGDSFDELLAQQANGEDSKAAQLIEGKTARWLASVAERVGSHLKGAKCIPSY